MTRLEQAVAIRDEILLRPLQWQSDPRSPIRWASVQVEGFDCLLTHSYAQPNGRSYSLEIWHGAGKVLNLGWDDHGHAKLDSLREPRAWILARPARTRSWARRFGPRGG